jgi:hypothetical protein
MTKKLITESYIRDTLMLIEEIGADDSKYLHPDLQRTIKDQLLALMEDFKKTGDHTLMPKDLTLGVISFRELAPRGYIELANRLSTLNHYADTGEICTDWDY